MRLNIGLENHIGKTNSFELGDHGTIKHRFQKLNQLFIMRMLLKKNTHLGAVP